MTTPTFTETLHAEVATLQAQHPILAGALDKAFTLVAGGHVFPLDDGRTAHVRSQSDPSVSHLVNGTCDCKATQYHAAPCAHRLAFRVYQRTVERLTVDPEEERWEPVADPEPPPVHGIPAQYLTTIQGRPFIRFEGLLALAHARGLVALETTVVQVSSDWAVCQSTARFQDGRVFTDIGDASPTNVKKHLAPHFVRMAATRASARALRGGSISICVAKKNLATTNNAHPRGARGSPTHEERR